MKKALDLQHECLFCFCCDHGEVRHSLFVQTMNQSAMRMILEDHLWQVRTKASKEVYVKRSLTCSVTENKLPRASTIFLQLDYSRLSWFICDLEKAQHWLLAWTLYFDFCSRSVCAKGSGCVNQSATSMILIRHLLKVRTQMTFVDSSRGYQTDETLHNKFTWSQRLRFFWRDYFSECWRPSEIE